ncbi:MAG: hypothetical protein WA869_35195, partial [Alloacidobacterium sp.]
MSSLFITFGIWRCFPSFQFTFFSLEPVPVGDLFGVALAAAAPRPRRRFGPIENPSGMRPNSVTAIAAAPEY